MIVALDKGVSLACLNALLLCLGTVLAHAEAIEFENFHQRLSLEPDGNRYKLLEPNLPVNISSKIIAKMKLVDDFGPTISRNRVVKAIQQLYLFKEHQYVLIELQIGINFAEAINTLRQSSDFSLIQPDILQLHDKAHSTNSAHQSTKHKYLEKLDSLKLHARGKGVKIAIIDDGFYLKHPALQHVNVGFSYDVARGEQSVLPQSDLDYHGTRVAGVIFGAQSESSKGGIAPEAELIAIRQASTWTSESLLALYIAKSTGADVVNCSWHTKILLEPVAQALEDLAQQGRGGKGAAVVVAAGNEAREITPFMHEAAVNSVITVGAISAHERLLKNSNYGSLVDFYSVAQPIYTADINGGYSLFSGTSLASATVSGVTALLFSMDPTLELEKLNERLTEFFVTDTPKLRHRNKSVPH